MRIIRIIMIINNDHMIIITNKRIVISNKNNNDNSIGPAPDRCINWVIPMNFRTFSTTMDKLSCGGHSLSSSIGNPEVMSTLASK